MNHKIHQRWLALLLAVSMTVGMSTSALAAESTKPEEQVVINASEDQSPLSDTTEAETTVSDYATFLADLKQLEAYASAYAADHSSENAAALVINYIRTGVDRYTSGTWATLAGAESTEFTEYVAAQDAENATEASALRNLEELTLPNGNVVDLGHMFGTLDITYYATVQGMTSDVIQARADLGGWAGDTADMMYCAVNVKISDKVDLTETYIDALADAIRTRYLGVEYSTLNKVSHSFTSTDLYGDLDAYYVASKLSDNASISSIIESYFTDSLSDADRAAYFLENRLGGVQTKAAIRTAVLNAYTSNALMNALEASYELTDLDNHDTIQKACLYAFADYLFELAGDDSGTDPDPTPTPDPDPEMPENGYYTVFSNTASTLAPGITQDITYALTADSKQIVYYTATIDVSRDDVSIYANYHDNDGSAWAMARVSDQMAAAQAKHSNPDDTDNYIENYNAVLGINADFYDMSTGAPSNALVMEGTEYHGATGNFFGILKDGTPIIGTASDYAAKKDQIQEAVGGSVYLVKDGKIAVGSDADYYNSRASRTCVGITADNKVVMMVLDGRQELFSAGGSAQEVAQIMLEAGCVVAINLDGGGSSTFDAKQEGSDEVSVVNRPSDGYERSVSSSLVVVSTAAKTNTFDHALITTDADYLTVGTGLTLTASGVSSTGNAAELPSDVTWQVSDASIGTIDDGVFTALAKGTTEVQLVAADGTVVGSKTLNVVVPDTLLFTRSTMDVVYGEAAELPLTATYNGNTVAINANDIKFELSNSGAGTMEGFDFTADEGSGIRNVKVTAMLARDYSISAAMSLALYSADEAKFDFDTAMYGDRRLAYNREVSNSTSVTTTVDDVTSYTYYIEKADEPMVTDYTFALDMQKVEVPDSLVPLLQMVAGGDLDNVTAWDILLQLAERVSAKTTVQVQIKFDQNVDVDYSALKVVNDYFSVSAANFDAETNTLTVDIGWIKQSEAIDAETANPIVIVSGISLTPKSDAAWDSSNQLTLTNSGTISYDIYLGANALYSMSSQTSFQQQYGIYPYTEPENTAHPNGGHFENTFREFTDTYTLDKTIKNGWATFDGNIYYYQDNEPLTGIQKLPGYQDESNEYYYDLGQDGVYTGKLTGLFELDGRSYYAINGALRSGWWLISDAAGEEGYYFFDPDTYQGLNGKTSQFFADIEYEFENGKLLHGVWLASDKGTRYYYGPSFVQGKWYTIDGNLYYFDSDGYRYEGYRYVKERDNHDDPLYWYDFGEDGICKGVYQYTGLLIVGENTYYINDGLVFNGLVLAEDGYYYYFSTSNYAAVKNVRYWVSYPNDTGFAQTFYNFDENGRMTEDSIPGPVTDPEKNGIVQEDGELYYYVNGAKTYAGLIQIDGDYHYVNSSCKVVTNQRYWISKTNDLLPATFYSFDAEGKMTDAPAPTPDPDPDPEVKNGIVNEDGELCYYVDGVKTYAGLIQIDDDYYYVNSYCKVITNQRYWISKTNDLLPATFYTFGADGKMER